MKLTWKEIRGRVINFLMLVAFWVVVAALGSLAVFFAVVEFMARWRLAFGNFK